MSEESAPNPVGQPEQGDTIEWTTVGTSDVKSGEVSYVTDQGVIVVPNRHGGRYFVQPSEVVAINPETDIETASEVGRTAIGVGEAVQEPGPTVSIPVSNPERPVVDVAPASVTPQPETLSKKLELNVGDVVQAIDPNPLEGEPRLTQGWTIERIEDPGHGSEPIVYLDMMEGDATRRIYVPLNQLKELQNVTADAPPPAPETPPVTAPVPPALTEAPPAPDASPTTRRKPIPARPDKREDMPFPAPTAEEIIDEKDPRDEYLKELKKELKSGNVKYMSYQEWLMRKNKLPFHRWNKNVGRFAESYDALTATENGEEDQLSDEDRDKLDEQRRINHEDGLPIPTEDDLRYHKWLKERSGRAEKSEAGEGKGSEAGNGDTGSEAGKGDKAPVPPDDGETDANRELLEKWKESAINPKVVLDLKAKINEKILAMGGKVDDSMRKSMELYAITAHLLELGVKIDKNGDFVPEGMKLLHAMSKMMELPDWVLGRLENKPEPVDEKIMDKGSAGIDPQDFVKKANEINKQRLEDIKSSPQMRLKRAWGRTYTSFKELAKWSKDKAKSSREKARKILSKKALGALATAMAGASGRPLYPDGYYTLDAYNDHVNNLKKLEAERIASERIEVEKKKPAEEAEVKAEKDNNVTT